MKIDDTVPTLLANASNWVIYRSRLLRELKSRSLHLHLTHTEAPKDSRYSSLEIVNGLDGPARWNKEEWTVKLIIANTVPDSTFHSIKGCKYAKDVWETVTKIYEERSKPIAIRLEWRLRNKMCHEGENVHTHFRQLTYLRGQLAGLGKPIDDEEYACLLLYSLPSSYGPTISIINACAYVTERTITPEIVIKIVGGAYDSKRRSIKNEKDTANAKNKKKDIKCLNCKKRGHLKADCWAKGGGKEGQQPIRRGQDKMRTMAAEECEYVGIAIC